ncbi:MAG TPA: hypothetical protein VF188_16840 [Longimicrobiales bacterium]
MRPGRRGSRIHAFLLGLAALAAAACAGDTVVVPESDAPFLYLVLNRRSLSQYDSIFEPHQLALLLTLGSTLEPSPYRTAERFEMRRASDGARFDWRIYPDLILDPGTASSVQLIYGNYHLPDTSGPAGLGADSVLPGETYTLEIDTEGVALRGEATVPAHFAVSVRVRDGQRIVEWPHVAGAAGYFVGAYPYSPELQTDTFYVIPADAPGGQPMLVTAVDANLYRYIADDELGRAGIDAGFGVFGGVSVASTTVPGR